MFSVFLRFDDLRNASCRWIAAIVFALGILTVASRCPAQEQLVGQTVFVKAWKAEMKSADRVVATIPYGQWSTIEQVSGEKYLVVILDDAQRYMRGWLNKSDVLVGPPWTPQRLKEYDRANELSEPFLRLHSEGKYREALPGAQQTVDAFRKLLGEEHPRTIDRLNSLATLYFQLGDYAKAEVPLRQVAQSYKKVLGDEHPYTANSMNNLAVLYRSMGDYAKAEPLYLQSLEIRKRILGDDDPRVAESLSNLAGFYVAIADYAKAEPLYLQSLEIRKRVLGDEHLETTYSLSGLAGVYDEFADYAKSESLYLQCLQTRRKLLGDEHPLTAETLGNLAGTYHSMAEYSKAELHYLQCIDIKKKVFGEEHPSTATSLHNLAGLYNTLGDHAKAGSLHQQSLEIRKEVLGEEHVDTAVSLYSLADLYRQLGGYQKAELLCQQSLQIFRKVLGDEHPDTARSLNTLALLYRATGEYEKAEPLLLQSFEIRKKVLGDEHPSTIDSLNNLGVLYVSQHNHAKAELFLKQSIELRKKVFGQSHPETASSLADLGTMYASQGRWEQAIEMFHESRRISRRHTSFALPTLSGREQLTFLKASDDAAYASSLSLGYHQRGEQHAPNMSAEWLLNGKGIAHEALAQGASLAQPEVAPLVRELNIVRGQMSRLSLDVPVEAAQRESHRERVATLESRERQLIGQLGTHRLGLQQKEPWVSLGQVREALPIDSLFVNIARFRLYDFEAERGKWNWQAARYVAWLIPSRAGGEVRIVDLGEAEPIERAVQLARTAIEVGKDTIRDEGEPIAEQAARDSLTELSKLVLAPLEEHLAGVRRLVLSPDGALWLVPWAALPTRDGKYAIETYQIRYVASGRELVDHGSPSSEIGPSVIMADPDFDSAPRQLSPSSSNSSQNNAGTPSKGLQSRLPRVPRLPGTAAEAQAIRSTIETYSGGAPEVYTAEDAHESQFKQLHRPRVLVLSTHGYFLADQEVEPRPDREDEYRAAAIATGGEPLENPLLRCGLMLAGCNRRAENVEADVDDGLLTGLEIVGTDLRGTELVVLSACETGLGEVQNGEGVAGLRQAFQLAGAESVMATLWQIPDRETAQLMNDFFAHLAAGESKPEALRLAQLARIASHRKLSGAAHPFFWAAFTLTGK